MFIAALFIITQKPSNSGTGRVGQSHPRGYYTAMRMNHLALQVTAWRIPQTGWAIKARHREL